MGVEIYDAIGSDGPNSDAVKNKRLFDMVDTISARRWSRPDDSVKETNLKLILAIRRCSNINVRNAHGETILEQLLPHFTDRAYHTVAFDKDDPMALLVANVLSNGADVAPLIRAATRFNNNESIRKDFIQLAFVVDPNFHLSEKEISQLELQSPGMAELIRKEVANDPANRTEFTSVVGSFFRHVIRQFNPEERAASLAKQTQDSDIEKPYTNALSEADRLGLLREYTIGQHIRG